MALANLSRRLVIPGAGACSVRATAQFPCQVSLTAEDCGSQGSLEHAQTGGAEKLEPVPLLAASNQQRDCGALSHWLLPSRKCHLGQIRRSSDNDVKLLCFKFVTFKSAKSANETGLLQAGYDC